MGSVSEWWQLAGEVSRELGWSLRRMADELFPPVVDPAADHGRWGGPWFADEPEVYCGRCGADLGPFVSREPGCPLCAERYLPWGHLVRLGRYEPPLSRWLLALKFSGQWAWAGYLGERLGEAIVESPGFRRRELTAFCWVPMPWRRRWRRGYNQAKLIAASAAREAKVPCWPLLRRIGPARPQTHVSPSRRASNVAKTFALEPVDLSGWDVWLIDDVTTSGATLRAGARLIRQAGADRVNVAVAAVARTAR